ncbi:MAG TPA: hypothetical protein ACYCDB_00475 [Candidatus Azoamicus sp.]
MLNLNNIDDIDNKLNNLESKPESVLRFLFFELPVSEFITIEHLHKFCTWIARSENFALNLYTIGGLSLSFRT